MGLAEFLEHFKQLHDQARKGKLDTATRGEYDRDRDELALALMNAQKTAPKPGERARSSLRVAKALQVEVGLPGERVKTTTNELWGRGFSALLSESPKAGVALKCSIRMPGGAESISGEAVVVESKRQPHNMRVTFQLQAFEPADLEKLEFVVFDEVLAKLGGPRK